MKALLRIALYSFLGALITIPCYSHSMYQAAVMLDFTGREVHAELQLPLERMEAAFGKRVQARILDRGETQIAAYVLSHFSAHKIDGSPFSTYLVSPLAVERVDGAPYVVARLVLRPPSRRVPEVFVIDNSVLLDRVPSQVALVSIRSDWKNSVFANDPRLIGVLRGSSRSVTIDRTGGSWVSGFLSIFKLGIRHIAEGTDHLLFLLALLLPAPLLLRRSRWSGAAGVRQSLLRILKVVTAFTVGHSITLALAALGIIRVPGRPIEVLIAASIFVSAIHALYPIFPGREAAIAAFFGLIHGLAFATTLGELGLGRWERVASILAFNLGIESMQLVVVVSAMPSLILLSRTRAYSVLRIGGALFAGFASAGWIAERLFGRHTPVDMIVDEIARQAVWIGSSSLLLSLFVWWFTYRGGQMQRVSGE